jgi:SAM-dependent methyltransferase
MVSLPKRLAQRIGLLEPARNARDAIRAWRYQLREKRGGLPSDGLPVPPARLILKVAGTPDAHWFLTGGRLAAESIRATLARHSIDIDRISSMLDFGCGCGRVVRHWRSVQGEVHGADYDPAGIKWCRRNLPFGRFEVNDLRPPLPYASGQFALVYALSVFTHLPANLQGPWMAELRRVLRPAGHLLISLHGTAYVASLTASELVTFNRGEVVVREGAPGSNIFGAYHPESYIRGAMSQGFRVLDVVPEGAAGNPKQDLCLFERTAEVDPRGRLR